MPNEKTIRMKFLGKGIKESLDLALRMSDDAIKTYREEHNISLNDEKIPFDIILQLAQLITLLEINSKLDKLNKK